MIADEEELALYEKNNTKCPTETIFLGGGLFFITLLVVMMLWFLCGCTISFQNISTHGTATDLVDEEQKADPTINPTITVPISPI